MTQDLSPLIKQSVKLQFADSQKTRERFREEQCKWIQEVAAVQGGEKSPWVVPLNLEGIGLHITKPTETI